MSLLTIFSAHVKFTVKVVLCVGSGSQFIPGVFKRRNDKMPIWITKITIMQVSLSGWSLYLSLLSSWIS